MLSNLQTRKITKLFTVLDSNGNGYFEAGDLDQLAERLSEGRSAKQQQTLKDRYQWLWRNATAHSKNGRVDLDGFIAHQDELLNTPGAYDGTIRSLTDFILELLDSDVDGKVTVAELETFYKAYKIDTNQAGAVFRKLDSNNDGFISRSEMSDHVADFFFSSDEGAAGNLIFGALA